MPNRKGAVCLSGFLTDYTNYILQKKWVDVTFQKKPREKQDSGKHQRYGKLDMLFIFLFAICRLNESCQPLCNTSLHNTRESEPGHKTAIAEKRTLKGAKPP